MSRKNNSRDPNDGKVMQRKDDEMTLDDDSNQTPPGSSHADEQDRRPTAGHSPRTRAKGKRKSRS